MQCLEGIMHRVEMNISSVFDTYTFTVTISNFDLSSFDSSVKQTHVYLFDFGKNQTFVDFFELGENQTNIYLLAQMRMKPMPTSGLW